ncbi:MAG: hypothetical protein HQ593_06725 [Candidatus Omnitrophica bacterium]|nr:hypothetical protein [Candidatus Omnitrophota bacterium]
MNDGVALILIIFLIMVCSLVALTAFSLLATGVESGLGFSESIQTLAIAMGGKEWYLEQLENDSDWSDEANQTGIALGSGTFDITVNSATSGSVSFTVTGKVTNALSQTVRREVTLTANRLPTASKFAVYWGRNTGSWLELRNSTTINGNFWSRGTTDVKSGCSVTGISYCPSNKNVAGAGSYTEVEIDSPYPSMPQIDETPYSNSISSFNAYINTYGTNSNRSQTTDLILSGNVIGCKNFTSSGNITISGNGYIVAKQNINLHSTDLVSGTLTITPSGGNIYFLAAGNLKVNSTQNDTNVTINSGAYLYSRAQENDNQLVRVRKHASTNTEINSAVIIGRRRIIVQSGADITSSTLYVSDVSDNNNYLQITGSGTTVSGSIISVSGRDSGLIINRGASVTGLVYHWGANSGYTQINTATIAGSVVCSQYTNDRIVNSTITYDADSLPLAPDGFESFVSVDAESWDDK